ncbi:family 31 putative glycosyltransferase [Triangularia setosa]|uniref:N-acetylgalactosaminide beta-1,3-galactosyltransferase n=1 Tax=Triangularia setosa TaxID=2587417 RepID=A0AAN7A2P0_9PEZI|nr:family 31 putative glycosyltransferase [Podospora setosa]
MPLPVSLRRLFGDLPSNTYPSPPSQPHFQTQTSNPYANIAQGSPTARSSLWSPRRRSRWVPRPLRKVIRFFKSNWLSLPLFLIVCFVLGAAVLPYDSTPRLAVRWNWVQLTGKRPTEDWVLRERARFEVNWEKDVGVVLKTGYGTRKRVGAWFESVKVRGAEEVLVIADFGGVIELDGEGGKKVVEVYDMVKRGLENPVLGGLLGHKRVGKYKRLTEAVGAGEEELAAELSKEFGWELDALKFLPGLEFAYERWPDKKWYLLVDDDTFLVETSLKRFLGEFDPEEEHYLGNAVGDFRARFAHGGSAVVLSQGAMRALVMGNPRALRTSYLESLDEVWGDRMLAKALIRVGIYLEEGYAYLFNGEPPRRSKIRGDRMCSPILSFHTLPEPEMMRDVGEHFRNVTEPVFWLDLWRIYGVHPPWTWDPEVAKRRRKVKGEKERVEMAKIVLPGVKSEEGCLGEYNRRFRDSSGAGWVWGKPEPDTCVIYRYPPPIEYEVDAWTLDWDYVGLVDEAVHTVENVASPKECMEKCTGRLFKKCIAWTWEPVTGKCHVSPWMIVGEKAKGQDKVSGFNIRRVRKLERKCPTFDGYESRRD